MQKLISDEDFVQYRLKGEAIPICIQDHGLNPYIKIFELLKADGLLCCGSKDEYALTDPGSLFIIIPFYFYTYDIDGEIYRTRLFTEHDVMDENEFCQIYIRCKANEKEYHDIRDNGI